MAVSVALNGAVSLPCCIIWCLHALSTKAEKNMFFGVKTSVGETCLGQSVALYGACRTFSRNNRRTISRNTRHLSPNLIRFEPSSDDNLGWVGPRT